VIIVPTDATGTDGSSTCPASHPNLVGGGYSGVGGANPNANFPSSSDTWTVSLNSGAVSWTVYAVCSE
jgi:hypothetical protein